nr:TlpA disulfide reductase family protein [uncultured Marinifilum sp.]
MKKLMTLCLVALTFLQVQAQEYKISGTIKGLDNVNGFRAIRDASAKHGWRMDTVKVENGKFSHTESITEPTVLRMSFRTEKLMKMVGRGYIPTKCVLLHYVAFPGADIKVNGEAKDFCDAYPSGDPENELMAKLNSKIYPYMNEAANLAVKHMSDTTLSEAIVKADEKRGEELGKLEQEAKMDFFSKHISSIAGLWMLEDMIIRSQIEMEKVAELMEKVDADKYKDLSYYKALAKRVEGFKTTGIGMKAPAIAGKNTLDGSDFDLTSLRGKYVIIDFWGTWCGACLAGVPEMKKFRDEHADRLQIVGVAKDDNVEKVQKCMEKKGMNWPNILVGKGEQDFVAKYNVQGFPTKILLDRNGKILLRSVGEKEDFYHEVEKLIAR